MSADDQIAVEKIVKKSGTSFFWGMKILSKKKKEECFRFMHFVELLMILLMT